LRRRAARSAETLDGPLTDHRPILGGCPRIERFPSTPFDLATPRLFEFHSISVTGHSLSCSTTERGYKGFVEHAKIIFKLTRDADGYPPVETEGLWARPLGNGLFELDNIPFYAREVSCEDIVAARPEGEVFIFERLAESRGHTTVRVIASDASEVPALRDALRALDCSSELSNVARFFTVDVPPKADYAKVLAILAPAERARCDFEESALRHADVPLPPTAPHD
jgi:hypothetical protein